MKETPEERIERAIVAARKVAATEEAKALSRRTGGKNGVWSREDEERLRRGEVLTPAGIFRLQGVARSKRV